MRGSLVTSPTTGKLMVTATAPAFSSSCAAGLVSVSVSFEEGEGDTFTATPVTMRVYEPPKLSSAVPCCAPAAEPTPILLKASAPNSLFASTDAVAPSITRRRQDRRGGRDYSEDDAMRIPTPCIEGGKAYPEAYIQLALDGQTPRRGRCPSCCTPRLSRPTCRHAASVHGVHSHCRRLARIAAHHRALHCRRAAAAAYRRRRLRSRLFRGGGGRGGGGESAEAATERVPRGKRAPSSPPRRRPSLRPRPASRRACLLG